MCNNITLSLDCEVWFIGMVEGSVELVSHLKGSQVKICQFSAVLDRLEFAVTVTSGNLVPTDRRQTKPITLLLCACTQGNYPITSIVYG